MHRRPHLPTAAGLLLLSLAATAQQGGWQVTMTELPLLPGGKYASAYAVNSNGKVLGVASDAAGSYHTVQWVNGQVSVIPDLVFGGLSVPEDLNDAGEGVGTQPIFSSLNHALFWDAQNNPSELPGLPGSGSKEIAHAINALGQVAGRAQEGMPNLYAHAVVWFQGALQSDLGFMGGGTYSEALGINDLGAVVGVANTSPNATVRAFLWQNGQYTDLSTWSGGTVASRAHAINDGGTIVGLNANVASIWENGAVKALPMPPGVSAFTPAIDINDAGDIIATGSKGFPDEVGVLWRDGTPIDLGTLPGGTISRARRISESGVIVGEARAADGFFKAVQWTVTPVATEYCTAKHNSLGCLPSIGMLGAPSASAGSGCALSVSNLVGGNLGIFIHSTTGAQALPFHAGLLCIQPPITRHGVLATGGTSGSCSGVLSEDFNAYVASGADPALVAGADVWIQAWARDPVAPFGDSLSDALATGVGP